MYKARDVVIYFSLKYHGKWEDIIKAIKSKEPIDGVLFQQLTGCCDFNMSTILDDDYPPELKNIYQPPFVLFYHGDIKLLRGATISVVGSRKVSKYGEQATIFLSEGFIKKGYTIISGMANGVDFLAHETALRNNGHTIAILGNGINYCYPKESLNLYQKLKQNHLVISEYPYATPPKKENFPFRNRLITALGRALVVPELKTRSGTLSTVSHALNQGKDIYCVPHPIFDETFNNQLIKEGAIILESVDDIVN